MKWSNLTRNQKIYIVVGLIVLAGISKLFEKPKPPIKPAEPKIEETVDRKGDIRPASDYVLGGVSKDDWDKLSEAQRIKDKLGITKLIGEGKVVPIEKGQKIMLIDYGFASSLYEVRVQEGSQAGRSCFIPREYFTGKFSE